MNNEWFIGGRAMKPKVNVTCWNSGREEMIEQCVISSKECDSQESSLGSEHLTSRRLTSRRPTFRFVCVEYTREPSRSFRCIVHICKELG